MSKLVPDPPFTHSDTSLDQSQKDAAYKRALDHYLHPASPQAKQEPTLFTIDPDTSFESALAHASSVLHCASVTAQQAGEQLDGTSRTLVLSVLHLVEMARVMVDRSLDSLQPR